MHTGKKKTNSLRIKLPRSQALWKCNKYLFGQEGDDSLLVTIVPVKPNKTPGKMKINFDNTGKERAEQKGRPDEEMKLKHEEQNQFLKETKCLSFLTVNRSSENI